MARPGLEPGICGSNRFQSVPAVPLRSRARARSTHRTDLSVPRWYHSRLSAQVVGAKTTPGATVLDLQLAAAYGECRYAGWLKMRRNPIRCSGPWSDCARASGFGVPRSRTSLRSVWCMESWSAALASRSRATTALTSRPRFDARYDLVDRARAGSQLDSPCPAADGG
jgi:hypothetical protein